MRREMRYIFNNKMFFQLQDLAVRCIQRNVRKWMSVREWPWWRLYVKVAPLLNVHRTEDQLKAKTVSTCYLFLHTDHFSSPDCKRNWKRCIESGNTIFFKRNLICSNDFQYIINIILNIILNYIRLIYFIIVI